MADKIGNINADDAMKALFKDREYIKIDDVIFIRKDKALELCNRAHDAQIRKREALQLHSVVTMLHKIAQCIDDAIENGENGDAVSEAIELMKAIFEDNAMFVRN